MWFRDWDDTWCVLRTGTIHVRFRDWDDTWCGLGTGMIPGVV